MNIVRQINCTSSKYTAEHIRTYCGEIILKIIARFVWILLVLFLFYIAFVAGNGFYLLCGAPWPVPTLHT